MNCFVTLLRGSIAVAGSALNWLKSVGLLESMSETDQLASSVESSGGLAFVPAFNGLFAPHWRTDARGMMIGITQVWSLTQFYSLDFSQSRIDVKKCVFNKRTFKVCVSCC